MSVEPEKALTVPQRAALALNQQENEAKLKELAETSRTITAITNADGYQQCHAARMALKNKRVEIEKTGKQAREDATAFSKAVIAEESRLIALIEPEEKRLGGLQKVWDDAREAERRAKIAAELSRVAALRERVAELRGNRTLSASDGSVLISDHIQDLEEIVVDDTFEEFKPQAEEAKAAGLAWLRELHTAAVAHEAEKARIQAERKELARLRTEQARREEEERLRLAEEERKATAAREAQEAELRRQREENERQAATERARIAEEERVAKIARAEQLRREREKQERAAAERQAAMDAETARQEAAARAERDRIAAEDRRLAEDRAEIERQKAALAPKPVVSLPTSIATDSYETPSASEIVAVLAAHYDVLPGTVIEWLTELDFSEVDIEEIAA